MMSPSKRSNVAPFYVMEVMRAAERREQAGLEVLHLEVGQPSTGAPAGSIAAVEAAMGTHNLGYTGAAGMPELRERIARWYHDRYGLDIAAERVVVTTGASGSCVLTFLAVFDAGARVGVLEPGYPCYRNDLEALGVEVVEVPVGHDSGFRPDIERLNASLPLDGLVIASPSNPTGTVLPPSDMAAIVEWCGDHGISLVVDEIYHGITYDVDCPSALEFGDDLIVFNSFSKYFSMTGWRLGWVVAPPAMAATIERLSQSLTIAPPTVSQVAALAAFECTGELDANVDRYRRNRRIMLDGLASAGLVRNAPADGAFYVWADVSHLVPAVGTTSQDLAAVWLDELGVAATPGIDFDRRRGHDFIRFSYASSTEAITEAMERIAGWIRAKGL